MKKNNIRIIRQAFSEVCEEKWMIIAKVILQILCTVQCMMFLKEYKMIFIINSAILLFLLNYGLLKDFMESSKKFIEKQFIDIIVSLCLYVFFIFTEYYTRIDLLAKVYCIIGIVVGIGIGKIACSMAKINSYVAKEVLLKPQKYKVLSISIMFIISMALIYSSLYRLNNSWFTISDINIIKPWEICFEFLYYSFSLLLTYSSGTIVATGIIPRIFQICHIGLFILIISRMLKIYISGFENKLPQK